jgi:hypothetical protein
MIEAAPLFYALEIEIEILRKDTGVVPFWFGIDPAQFGNI